LGVIELTVGGMPAVEKLGDAGEGIVAYVFDELLEVLCVSVGELAGVGVDGGDEGRGGVGEEVVELLELLVHFGDGLDHYSLNI